MRFCMNVCRKDLQTSFWWMNSLLVLNSCEFSLVRHLHFFSKTQSTLTQMLAMQSSFINVDWVHMWCWTVICIYSLNLMFSCMILWQVHPYPELTATTFCIINHGTTNIDTPGIQFTTLVHIIMLLHFMNMLFSGMISIPAYFHYFT